MSDEALAKMETCATVNFQSRFIFGKYLAQLRCSNSRRHSSCLYRRSQNSVLELMVDGTKQ
jgi:hypothetical protein